MLFKPAPPSVFIVGCPRSGTTVLQGLLAAHPAVASFPETHFFVHSIPGRQWLQRLGIARPHAIREYRRFLHSVNHPHPRRAMPAWLLTIKAQAGAFLRTMQWLAARDGKRIWLEKTPRHLHYIDWITRLIPNVSIIHIVRNGYETVASLYRVTHLYPKQWGGARSAEQCARRWMEDVSVTLTAQERPRHVVVQFEYLLLEPTHELKRLCHFLNLPYDDELVARYTDVVGGLITDEPWKKKNTRSFSTVPTEQFDTVFTRAQRETVRSLLETFATNGMVPGLRTV